MAPRTLLTDILPTTLQAARLEGSDEKAFSIIPHSQQIINDNLEALHPKGRIPASLRLNTSKWAVAEGASRAIDSELESSERLVLTTLTILDVSDARVVLVRSCVDSIQFRIPKRPEVSLSAADFGELRDSIVREREGRQAGAKFPTCIRSCGTLSHQSSRPTEGNGSKTT
jgi:hypothetical protein